MLPNSLFYIGGFFRSVVAYFHKIIVMPIFEVPLILKVKKITLLFYNGRAHRSFSTKKNYAKHFICYYHVISKGLTNDPFLFTCPALHL